VNLPAAELGTRAVELLMRRLADGGDGEVELIPPALTARGSTGPASSGGPAGANHR
jgi:DNA-binding LacI/PurR family transcriptional regulator